MKTNETIQIEPTQQEIFLPSWHKPELWRIGAPKDTLAGTRPGMDEVRLSSADPNFYLYAPS